MLIINLISILHNLGIFNYNKLALLNYCIQILLFPLCITMILIVIYLSYTKKQSFILFGLTGFTIIIMIYCGLTWKSVYSKLLFAKGYQNYLNREDLIASQLYINSFKTDKTFYQSMSYLIEIENVESYISLEDLLIISKNIKDDNIQNKIARLLENKNNYSEAARVYELAEKLESSNGYSVDIIRCLFLNESYDSCLDKISQINFSNLSYDQIQDIEIYHAKINYIIGLYEQSKNSLEALLKENESNADLYYYLGLNYIALTKPLKAILNLNKSIKIKKEYAEAYFELGKLYNSQNDYIKALEMLNKCIYYDNTISKAYLLKQKILENNKNIKIEILRDETISIELLENSIIILTKGEHKTVFVKVKNIQNMENYKIALLEPYGFGFVTKNVKILDPRGNNCQSVIDFSFEIEALRSNKINLDNPWILNIIFLDLESNKYINKEIAVEIVDSHEEKGRILFVLSEDLEQTGDFPHIDATPEIIDIDPQEIKIDLIEKSHLADTIGNTYGIKWSHFLDIGSALLRLDWIGETGIGIEWEELYLLMKDRLKDSISNDNDIQLHIHGYSIPGNKLSRQYYNPKTNKIEFIDNIIREKTTKGTNGAWSDNFTDLGNYEDISTRIGSIFQGIELLESLFHSEIPSYRTLIFRAGEYEFGSTDSDIRNSITALKKNKILASSNAYRGDVYNRNFKFFNRIGSNVYFTKNNSILESSQTLNDIGILEILPVPVFSVNNYAKPIDPWNRIHFNYNACIKNGAIDSGIFIIMEMYHIGNTNHSKQWSNTDASYGDWSLMNDQFKKIKETCPELEIMTTSEAVKTYLAYFSPDVIALRTNEMKLSKTEYSYDIELIGDILIDRKHPHYVSIKPPSYFLDQITNIELFYKEEFLKSWDQILSYSDLVFTITDNSGYWIKVKLKE